MKPLVTAMSSLEAALSVQENMSRQHLQNFQDKASALERMHHEQQEYRLKHAVNASGQAPASVDRVQQMIDDAVRDRRLGEVTNRDVLLNEYVVEFVLLTIVLETDVKLTQIFSLLSLAL